MAASPPSFVLRISYTGLCLFVRDERTPDKPRLHVLLIDPSQRPGDVDERMPGGMPPHTSKMYYDAAYERAGATARDGTMKSAPVSGSADLSGLALAGLGTASAPRLPSLPREVLDMDGVTGARVQPRWVDDACGGELSARITVAGGTVTDYDAGGPWSVNGGAESYLAWRVGIAIPVLTETSVTFPTGPTTSCTLHPIAGLLSVAIKNVTAEEQHPEDPRFELPSAGGMVHLAAYNDLYPAGTPTVNAVVTLPRPRRAGTSPLGSVYYCTLAQGSV